MNIPGELPATSSSGRSSRTRERGAYLDAARFTHMLVIALVWVTFVLSTGAFLPAIRSRMSGTSGDTGDPLQQVIWLALLGVFLVAGIVRGATLWNTLRLNPLLIVLHLLTLVSIAWSIDRSLTFRRSVAVLLTAWLGVYLAAVFEERQVVHLLANALAFVTIASLIVCLALPSVGISNDPYMLGAWQGVFVHKNMLGLSASLTVVAWFLLLLFSKRNRVVSLLVLGVSLFVLVQSDSQTSLLITVFILPLILCFPLVRHVNQGVTGGLVIAMALTGPLAAFLVFSNLETITAVIGRDATFTGRTTLWSEAMEKILEKPLLGYGFDSFWRGLTGPSADVVTAMQGFSPLTAHNGLLEMALDLGIIGLAPFLLLVVVCINEAVVMLRRGVTLETSFIAYFIGFFVMYNLVESTVLQFNAVSWILFCYVTSVLMRRRSSRISALRRRVARSK